MKSQSQPHKDSRDNYQAVICLSGNDGTGKSTLAKTLNNLYPHFLTLERSTKTQTVEHIDIVKHLKYFDTLTYLYPYEQQKIDFQIPTVCKLENARGKPLRIYWFLIQTKLDQIFRRVSQRDDLSIYESEKCIKYFDQVYREMAYFYGIPIVRNDGQGKPVQCVAHQIVDLVTKSQNEQNQTRSEYNLIRSFGLKYLTYEKIQQLDIQSHIKKSITDKTASEVYSLKIKEVMKNHNSQLYQFYYPELQEYEDNIELIKALAARWIVRYGTISEDLAFITFRITNQKTQTLQLKHTSVRLFRCVEGESKILYQFYTNQTSHPLLSRHFKNKVLILLKSTIYSHRKQHTSQISNLGQIRAHGSTLFLEMMRRNDLKHAYICLNSEGIILSQKISNINKLEIVFKKQCIGTDKYSYHGITQPQLQQTMAKLHISRTSQSESIVQKVGQFPNSIVDNDSMYRSSVYIRYDWRNPNHVLKSNPSLTLNQDPYYYPIQSVVKKQTFFGKFLSKCLPMGDRCITKDMLSNYINRELIDRTMIKMYCTLAYYLNQVDLELVDGCVMMEDKAGTIWSEINPDCMRIKAKQGTDRDYDKDIWREGGSSAKEKIIQKWSLFNKIISEYFLSHRFHKGEVWDIGSYPYQVTARAIIKQYPNNLYSLIYSSLIRGHKSREIIATIDLRQGSPILVKSSKMSQTHSQHSVKKSLQYLSIFNKIVMVDLDAVLSKQQNINNQGFRNPQLISKYAKQPNSNLFAVGGGVRTLQTVSFYKKSLVSNLILSTNLELIDTIQQCTPECQFKQGVIVQLSVNQKNEVLTHGRTVNTHINVLDKIRDLLNHKGIKNISITFVKTEGQLSGLPRQQIKQLMVCIPGRIEKVIIAGGVTTIEDLQFLWGFDKCIPQLGAAIWKRTIDIGKELFPNMIKWKQTTDKGVLLCPVIIYSTQTGSGVLGEVFMDKEALCKTVQTRQLWRYSREHQKVIRKGQTSNNLMKVAWMRLDCDQDCILVGVQPEQQEIEHNQFCHLGRNSCFETKTNHTHDFTSLQKFILSRKDKGGYSSKLQNNQGLAYLKLLQQIQELELAERSKHKQIQCADAIAHLLMYINSKQIDMGNVFQELTRRSQRKKLPIEMKDQGMRGQLLIGIVSGKHCGFCDDFVQKSLGILIKRCGNRNLMIKYEIQDGQKLKQFLPVGTDLKQISFLGMKSKDMSAIMVKSMIRYCINYSIMMENWPTIAKCLIKKPCQSGLRLALIKRSNEKIDPHSWTPQNKGKIVSQYPVSLANYLNKTLNIKEDCYTIIRVSGCSQSYLTSKQFHYCDAIIITGTTLKDNDLQIEAILEEKVCVGLYQLL